MPSTDPDRFNARMRADNFTEAARIRTAHRLLRSQYQSAIDTEHVLMAHAGCRNTILNGVAPTATEYTQRLMQAGARRFRSAIQN